MAFEKPTLPVPEGHVAPVVYDVSLDQWRLATQADLDVLLTMNNTYGAFVTAARKLLEEHETCRAECIAIQNKDTA